MKNKTADPSTTESKKITERDPITAIATPVGEGGIAVIRVSGKKAIATVNEAFKGADLTQQDSHTVHFGKVVDANDEVVDEVLTSLFYSPKNCTQLNKP